MDRISDVLDHEAKITYDRLGRYHLHVSVPLPPPKSKPHIDTKDPKRDLRVCALDPGVRTFATSYDQCGRSGDGVSTRLAKTLHGADKLRKKLADKTLNFKHQTRRNLRRRILRIFEDVRCLVREMHRRIANVLCAKYDVILLPEFET